MGNGVHLLPGRLRLAVPNLKGNNRLAVAIREVLSATPVMGFSSPNDLSSPKEFSVPKQRSGALAPFREPEDLSLGRQVMQVMFSGAVLLVLFFKHRIFGRSALSYSSQLFHLAAITTVVTGYPIFYNGLQQLATRRRVNYNLVIRVTITALLILRESFTGLLVTWVVNLAGLLQTLNLIKANQAIKNDLLSGNRPDGFTY